MKSRNKKVSPYLPQQAKLENQNYKNRASINDVCEGVF